MVWSVQGWGSLTSSKVLSDTHMAQADVFRMVGRRARATGITEYLRKVGKL